MGKKDVPPSDAPSGKHGAGGTAKRTGPGESAGKHRPENVNKDGKGGKK